MRQIKMIWDFRGVTASRIATHHEIHLKEFIEKEKIPVIKTGTSSYSEVHSIAYLVVAESELILVRDSLKPHRAELYE